MQFKRFLIGLFVVSLVVYAAYAMRIIDRYQILALPLNNAYVMLAMAAAIVLVITGHIIRSYKARELLAPSKDSGTKTQFQSLLIGYLFNTLLPLRLGEIVRAFVLGRSLKISASFMFGLIVLERCIDGVIIACLGLGASLVVFQIDPVAGQKLVIFSLILLGIAFTFLSLLCLLHSQNRVVLRVWSQVTALFNTKIRNSLRFKLWATVYGLQKVLHLRSLIRYVALSLLMWIFYLAALTILAIAVFGALQVDQNIARSVISFIGLSIPSGPASLGAYQAITDPLLQAVRPGTTSMTYLVISWFVLIVPSSLLGIGFLLHHRTKYGRLVSSGDKSSLKDKLSREHDISQELAAFLDAFFVGNTLSHILHRLERDENIKLIQYFKGGSDASTILVHQENEYIVKKIIPNQYANRLKAQHNWLKEHSHHDNVVTLKRQTETPSYYAIDIEYYPDYKPFFDYIHSQSLARSQKIESGVFTFLFDHIYQLEVLGTDKAALEAYIASKFEGKLKQASKLSEELTELRSHRTIVVNGVEYDNLDRSIEKIRHNKSALHDISTFRKSHVHGDITVDNILASVKDSKFMIIDPAPDQLEVSGPVFDFGRHYQSLGYGYEFLCRDNSAVHAEGNVIQYEDSTSAAYRDLEQYFVKDITPKWLTPEEQRAVKFHTAMNYSRVLAHRVHINPKNIAKFYGVSVRAMHDFLKQYD